MGRQIAITTIDNPYDPLEQFDLWNAFDIEHQYYSCARLARIAKLSDDMTQQEEDEEIERGIDAIIANDLEKQINRKNRTKL